MQQARQMADWQRENTKQREEMFRSLELANAAKDRKEQDRIQREIASLDHLSKLAQAQVELLRLTQRQAADSVVDRRIQYAVMVVSCAAFVAAIGFGVVTITDSMETMWISVAVAALVVYAVVFLVLQALRKPAPGTDDTGRSTPSGA